MPRRSELQGIANNLVASFASRNNDVNGYWALGKLYLFAKQGPSLSICVQLLPAPDSGVPEPISAIAVRAQRLLEQLTQKQGLPAEWLKTARICVEFESPKAKPMLFLDRKTGHPALCTAALTDDLDCTYEASVASWCWPHDPHVESQSSRAQSDA